MSQSWTHGCPQWPCHHGLWIIAYSFGQKSLPTKIKGASKWLSPFIFFALLLVVGLSYGLSYGKPNCCGPTNQKEKPKPKELNAQGQRFIVTLDSRSITYQWSPSQYPLNVKERKKYSKWCSEHLSARKCVCGFMGHSRSFSISIFKAGLSLSLLSRILTVCRHAPRCDRIGIKNRSHWLIPPSLLQKWTWASSMKIPFGNGLLAFFLWNAHPINIIIVPPSLEAQ